jgi:putative ABC transport system substrate-binding protein
MIRRLAGLALLFASLAAMAQPRLVAIANFGEHPALRAAVNGFKAEVVRQGFVEGRDVAFDDQHINFDRTLIAQLLTNAAAKKPAMIVAVTTPVAQSSIRVVTDKSVPIVFMSVVDPVVAKIVPSWQAGSDTHTGATLYPDFNASLAFVRQLLPNARRLGIPYNPGEDNDTTNMKEMRAAAPKHGFEVVEVGVDNANEIPQRLQSLAGKVDAVFVIQSNILQTSLPVIAATTQRMGVPAINTLDTPVRQHQFLAAHALSYERMGANAGRIAARILKGEKPAAIPPHRPGPEDFSIVISRKQLAQWKLEVPPALAKNVID